MRDGSEEQWTPQFPADLLDPQCECVLGWILCRFGWPSGQVGTTWVPSLSGWKEQCRYERASGSQMGTDAYPGVALPNCDTRTSFCTARKTFCATRVSFCTSRKTFCSAGKTFCTTGKTFCTTRKTFPITLKTFCTTGENVCTAGKTFGDTEHGGCFAHGSGKICENFPVHVFICMIVAHSLPEFS